MRDDSELRRPRLSAIGFREASRHWYRGERLRYVDGCWLVLNNGTPLVSFRRWPRWSYRYQRDAKRFLRWGGQLSSLALLLLGGCASLTHEPGTPYGGAYCTQRGGDPEPACYPSEAERVAAWKLREAEGRRAWAAEHPAEARAAVDERARIAVDSEARQRAKAQERADLAAARAQEAEDSAAARAAEQAGRDTERARLELAHARTIDPAFASPALSALLCREKAREAEFRADLQREARITAISGVIDKRSRSSLAAGVVDAQDRVARLRERLHAVGGAALPCADVAPLLACRAGDEMACRSAPGARDKVDVLREIERAP